MFSRSIDNSGKVTKLAIQGSVHILRTRLKVCKGNICIRGAQYYNKIQMDIREAKTVKSFKHRLKRAHVFAKEWEN